MSDLKKLTKEQVPLLQHGDKLTLDTKIGGSFPYLNHRLIERDLHRAQLSSGNQYTFDSYRGVYKSGEGTLIGWYINVAEARHEVDIPYEYFAIGQDLEGQLAAREKSTN